MYDLVFRPCFPHLLPFLLRPCTVIITSAFLPLPPFKVSQQMRYFIEQNDKQNYIAYEVANLLMNFAIEIPTSWRGYRLKETKLSLKCIRHHHVVGEHQSCESSSTIACPWCTDQTTLLISNSTSIEYRRSPTVLRDVIERGISQRHCEVDTCLLNFQSALSFIGGHANRREEEVYAWLV